MSRFFYLRGDGASRLEGGLNTHTTLALPGGSNSSDPELPIGGASAYRNTVNANLTSQLIGRVNVARSGAENAQDALARGPAFPCSAFRCSAFKRAACDLGGETFLFNHASLIALLCGAEFAQQNLQNVSRSVENFFSRLNRISLPIAPRLMVPRRSSVLRGERGAMASWVAIGEFLDPDSATISASLIHVFVSYCRNDSADRDEGRVRAYRTCVCVHDFTYRVHVQRRRRLGSRESWHKAPRMGTA